MYIDMYVYVYIYIYSQRPDVPFAVITNLQMISTNDFIVTHALEHHHA